MTVENMKHGMIYVAFRRRDAWHGSAGVLACGKQRRTRTLYVTGWVKASSENPGSAGVSPAFLKTMQAIRPRSQIEN